MKRKLLFVAALVASALGFNAHAQDDVTDQYLTNPDFETSPIFDGTSLGVSRSQDATATNGSNLIGGTNSVYGISGWTNIDLIEGAKNVYSRLFTMPYDTKLYVKSGPDGNFDGTGGQEINSPRNGSSVSEENKYLLLVETNWNASANLGVKQDVKLPQGVYKLAFDSYVSNNLGYATSLCGVKIGNSATYVWPKNLNTWTSNEVYFIVEENNTPVEISMGYVKAKNEGGGTSAYLWVDNVKLYLLNENIPAEASKTSVTDKIVNPNADSNFGSPWMAAGSNVGEASKINGGNGFDGRPRFFEPSHWGAEGWYSTISQKITDLKSGLYILQAAVQSASDVVTVLTAGTSHSAVLPANGTGNGTIDSDGSVVEPGQGVAGWNYGTVTAFVTDGTLEIGVYSAASAKEKWTNIDNFTLSYIPEEDLLSLDILKNDLKELQKQANGLLDGTYKNVSDTNAEKIALKAMLDNEPEENFAAYKKAISDLQDAITAFQNVDYHAYDEYFYENQTAELLGIEVNAELQNPTTAEDAEEYAHQINVLNYNTVVEKGYRDVSESVLGAWKDNNVGDMKSQHWDGTSTSSYFEQAGGLYDRQSWDMSRTQDITTLKPGEYILQVAARVSAFADATLSVTIGENVISTEPAHHGDVGLGITTAGVASYNPADTYANGNKGRGFEWRYIPFTVTEEGQKVTLSFAAEGKAQYQYVSFTSLGILTNPVAAAKTTLLAEINNVTSIIEAGYNIGEGVFQFPVEAKTTLEAALIEAQQVYDESTDADELTAALEELQAAKEVYANVELNAPDPNKRYTLQNRGDWTDPIYDVDWSGMTGGYLTFVKGDRPDQGGYGVNLGVKDTRQGYTLNPAYAQAFIFTKAEGFNKYYISQIDDDGETTRYLTTAKTAYGTDNTNASYIQIRTTTEKEKAYAFTIVLSSTEGQFTINVEDANNGAIDFQDQGAYVGGYGRGNFAIAEAKEAEVTLNIKAGKYGTVIFPFVPNIPEGAVAVKTIEEIDTDNVLAMTDVDEPKANVPYILYSETGCNVTVAGYGTASADSYTDAAGLLTGAYTSVVVPEGAYVLQTHATEEKPEGVQAFYRVNGGTTISTLSYRAYLSKPSEAKAFYFGFDDATAIEAIPEVAEGTENAVFYNLAGQRVQNPTKGIYIVNGKKVLVK